MSFKKWFFVLFSGPRPQNGVILAHLPGFRVCFRKNGALDPLETNTTPQKYNALSPPLPRVSVCLVRPVWFCALPSPAWDAGRHVR